MATEPTDPDHDTVTSGRTWMECDATDCTDSSAYGLQYRTYDDDGRILSNGSVAYCPYHCAVRERAIRATPDRELDRLDVFTEYFETWTPPRPYQAYNIHPLRELKLLRDYLEAQDATGNPDLESRITGVEGALTLLREDDDMYGVIRSWDEPWKNSRAPASGP